MHTLSGSAFGLTASVVRQHTFVALGVAALGIGSAFVSHEGFESYASVRAYAAIFDLAFVEKLDQRRPRDVEHVGGFLRGEFGVDRDQCNCVSARHFLQDVDKHLDSGCR